MKKNSIRRHDPTRRFHHPTGWKQGLHPRRDIQEGGRGRGRGDDRLFFPLKSQADEGKLAQIGGGQSLDQTRAAIGSGCITGAQITAAISASGSRVVLPHNTKTPHPQNPQHNPREGRNLEPGSGGHSRKRDKPKPRLRGET